MKKTEIKSFENLPFLNQKFKAFFKAEKGIAKYYQKRRV